MSAITATLPAEAAAVISQALSAEIRYRADLGDCDRIQVLLVQQGYFAKAWNEPADKLMRFRLGDRCWNAIRDALETQTIQHGEAEVQATIKELQTAILRRDGLLNEDGTIDLPDMP